MCFLPSRKSTCKNQGVTNPNVTNKIVPEFAPKSNENTADSRNSEPKLSIEEIKSKIQAVCICKGIKMGRICDAIMAGAQTVEAVNKATGSGSGGCQATRCRPVIEKLIASGGRPLTREALEDKKEEEDDDFFWTPPTPTASKK
jgi:NAD(P)H-nitrite reductase large subunit